MSDPFSITVGTVQLIDVCWRVGTYLKEIEKSAGKVEEEIAALSREITSLISVNESIEKLRKATGGTVPGGLVNNEPDIQKLWALVDANTNSCRTTVQKLEELLKVIIGKNGPQVANKIDGIRKALRRQSKDGELLQINHELSKYQATLHTLLNAINM
jgi:hypothetical protein